MPAAALLCGGAAPREVAAWTTLPPTPALPAPASQGDVSVDGARLRYFTFGQGDPVLLLHGGLANSDWWGHQVASLRNGFRVIALDTRGHGRSTLSSRPPSYALFATDVVAVMDALRIERAAIVGWSDGGITGLQLALTRPERLSRLFAFGVNSNPQGLIGGGGHRGVFPEFVRRCRSEYDRLAPEPANWGRLVRGLQAMWRSQPDFPRARLAGIRSPVTVADGEHDEIIAPAGLAELAGSIPGARLRLEPGVGHFAMLQNSRQFNADVLEFLRDR